MKTLVVVRHGKSDWTTGVPDQERPLNTRGQRQAVDTGQWLAAHVPTLDRAVVSPAERTRATWALIAAQYADPPEVTIDERLYFGRVNHVVEELAESTSAVVLVGHNPDVEVLIERLSGQSVDMPTSCVAVLEWDGGWLEGTGRARLTAHGRPPV